MPGACPAPPRVQGRATPVLCNGPKGPMSSTPTGTGPLTWSAPGLAIAGHAHPRVVEAVEGRCRPAQLRALLRGRGGPGPENHAASQGLRRDGACQQRTEANDAPRPPARAPPAAQDPCPRGATTAQRCVPGGRRGARPRSAPTSLSPPEVARHACPVQRSRSGRAGPRQRRHARGDHRRSRWPGTWALYVQCPAFEGLRDSAPVRAPLIFDEVRPGSASPSRISEYLQIRPDITCPGKVIGGGMPVAAYAGSVLMEKLSPVARSIRPGTPERESAGMAAGLATLELCSAPGFKRLANRRQPWPWVRRLRCRREPPARTARAACSGSPSPRPIRNFADAKAGDHTRCKASPSHAR
jgi:hypothetical protein